MSLYYNNNAGVLTPVSGLNGQSGELVVGTSSVRTGTVSSGTMVSYYYKDISVTFSSPMPDADYVVELGLTNASTTSVMTGCEVVADSKTASGFKVRFFSKEKAATTTDQTWTASYKAFKVYKAEDISQAQDDIATLKASLAALQTVTSGTATPNATYLTLGGTDSISWVKRGGVATVTIEVNPGNSTLNLTPDKVLALATGVPKTLNNMLVNGYADFLVNHSDGYCYNAGHRLWIDGDGRICFFVQKNAWKGCIHSTFTYVCQ